MKVAAIILCLILMAGCNNDQPTTPTEAALLQPQTTLTYCPQVDVDLTGCSNHQGSEVELSGTVTWPALSGQFILRNNAKGTHEATSTIFTIALSPGGTVTLDKEPIKGGVGGNPHISFQLIDSFGNPIGDEVYLGRCVQQGQ